MNQIIINGYSYRYYTDYSILKKQIKRVKEKIRASENGCYKDCYTRQGRHYYTDYPALLEFLNTLL